MDTLLKVFKSHSANETEADFATRCTEIVEHGFLCMAINIGHKLGLFDLMGTLASETNPKTSEQIAEAGQFKERYRQYSIAIVLVVERVWMHLKLCLDMCANGWGPWCAVI